VAPSKIDDRAARANRERLKGYKARQSMHQYRIRRRVRDNWIAVLAIIAVAAGATFAQVAYFSVGPGTPVATTEPEPTETTPPTGENVGNVPDPALAEGRTWTGTLTINDVPLGIELDGAAAPQGVASFISLGQSGFYTDVACHRLTNGGFFVLQCGDPEGDGSGGPGYSYGPVENAPEDEVYPAGTLAMARQSGNAYSNGSQFFVVYEDTTIPADAAGGYTVLGTVTSGLDELKANVIDKGTEGGVTDGPPAVPVAITGVAVE
jgi:peptidyl-prolyl cis-trans isomerase B (cyclophilin B)